MASLSEVSRELLGVAAIAVRRSRARLHIGPNTLGSTCVMLDETGRVLLVKTRYHRSWTSPGGYANPGEDPTDAVLRELREEIGLVIGRSPAHHSRSVRRGGHEEHVYRLDLDHDETEMLRPTSWEIAQLGWFGPNDVPAFHPITRARLIGASGVLRADGARWRWADAPPH